MIVELLRTGLTLVDLLSSLLEDLPDDAFPGEENGEVLIEMVAGSCAPVFVAAGPAQCEATVALLGAIRDRVLHDLSTAAELATRKGE
ncbi:MAG TPA: hypothetical protein VG458_07895 [Solirubrobacterales bacterium]|nr:hypothetical protein [Solirubrobacterales bacterium]